MPIPPPSLTLPSKDLTGLFSEPSQDNALKLSSLINKELSSEDLAQRDTTSLDALLSSISQQAILSAFAHSETIDEYITFLSFAALQINSDAVHPGNIIGDERPTYKTTNLRPVEGPKILGEMLSKSLYDSMWGITSRATTANSETDRKETKEYYIQAAVQGSLLARAFVLGVETFRDPLWRNVEDIFVKGLFSGDEQEPAIFVALAAVFLGAGKEIKEYMGHNKLGQGKAWLWYDDVRTEPDARWGWDDVVGALKVQPMECMARGDRLPEYVKESFSLAKQHILNGDFDDWDSVRLRTEAFKWVESDA